MLTEFGGKVALGPLEKSLDFGDNPAHVTLWLGLRLHGAETHPATLGIRRLFQSNNFVGSTAIGGCMRCAECHFSFINRTLLVM